MQLGTKFRASNCFANGALPSGMTSSDKKSCTKIASSADFKQGSPQLSSTCKLNYTLSWDWKKNQVVCSENYESRIDQRHIGI